MTHPSGQTRHSAFPFDAKPCDARLRQRVEGVTFEGLAPGREDDDDGLVRHDLDASRQRVTLVTILPPKVSFARASNAPLDVRLNSRWVDPLD